MSDHRRRVVVVDDSHDLLELVRLALEDDYDVLTLSDPIEIMEMISIFEPDLLIVDVMMPKISGFQLTEMLQKDPRTRELPIIILSAKDTTRDIKHGYRVGASLYLTKPFEPQRLLQNVEAQLNINGPEPGPKTYTLEEIVARLQATTLYQKGVVQLGSTRLVQGNLKRRENVMRDRQQRF
jgi:DNA-binding response OmpR family regulator